MEEAIKNFHQQFSWEPKIEYFKPANKFTKFVVCGMGGSHLSAGIYQLANPKVDLIIHRDYGLPVFLNHDSLDQTLVIISSYSGNTAEAIDAFREAKSLDLSMAVISTGGKLLELAKDSKVAYIQLPLTNLQPRLALGYSLKALVKLINDDSGMLLSRLSKLNSDLNPEKWREAGARLAVKIGNLIPTIYSSTANLSLAYNWKIKLNETGKTPAFYNVSPELNHNELESFNSSSGSRQFFFIFINDEMTDPRINQSLGIVADLLKSRGFPTENISLSGADIWEKIFNCLLLADWTAYAIAQTAGVDPEKVPVIEELKQRLIS